MPELGHHKVDHSAPLDHRVWLNTGGKKSKTNIFKPSKTVTRADIEGPSVNPNMSPRTMALERRLQALQVEHSFWKTLLYAQRRLTDIHRNIQGMETERHKWEKAVHDQERVLLYKILAESKTDSPLEDLGIDHTSRNQYLLERLPSIVDRLKQQVCQHVDFAMSMDLTGQFLPQITVALKVSDVRRKLDVAIALFSKSSIWHECSYINPKTHVLPNKCSLRTSQ